MSSSRGDPRRARPPGMPRKGLAEELRPDVLSLAQRFLSREEPPNSRTALIRAIDRELMPSQGGRSRVTAVTEILKQLAAEGVIKLPKWTRRGGRKTKKR